MDQVLTPELKNALMQAAQESAGSVDLAEKSSKDPVGRPAGSLVKPQLPNLYNQTRDVDIAQGAAGRVRLKRLNAKHRNIVMLHLSGWNHTDIAEEMGMAVGTIRFILSDPLVKTIINETDALYDEEFDRLRALATGVVREAMHPEQPIRNRLAGVAAYSKLESNKKDTNKGTSAEDIMQKIVAKITSSDMKVNIVGTQNIHISKEDSGNLIENSG